LASRARRLARRARRARGDGRRRRARDARGRTRARDARDGRARATPIDTARRVVVAMADDADAPTPTAAPASTAYAPSLAAYAPSFEDLDGAITSALDAIDGAAESLFRDDRARATSATFDDDASRLARAWTDARWDDARRAMRDAQARCDARAAEEREAKRRLKETLTRAANDGEATKRALAEEVTRLTRCREEDLASVRAIIGDGAVLRAESPEEMLSTAATIRRELDATRAELDAAKKATIAASTSGANAESLKLAMEAKIAAKMDEAMKTMKAKTRAAESSADAARQGKAAAEQKLSALQKQYDDVASKLFDVENAMESNEARNAAEKEELVSLGEELRRREEALEAHVERARATENATASRDERAESQVLEKLAVKERMVSQLAAEIETHAASAKEAAEKHAAERESLNAEIAALRQEVSKARDAAQPSTESVALKAEIANLTTRVKMLQEISGVEVDDDGATGGHESSASGAEAMQSLRERIKKLTAELAVARREKEDATTSEEIAKASARAAERKYTETAAMVATLETDLSTRLSEIIEDRAVNGSPMKANAASSESTDLLTILTSQRDRFKRRVGELDDRAARLEQEKIAAEDAKAKLEADSVQLYEKLQYVQNYYAKQLASSNGRTTILRVDAEGIPVTDGVVASSTAQSQRAKNARYSCGAVTLNIESERTAAAVDGMRRRAARYGCFGGAHAESDIPGGDTGGVVSRYRRKYLARLNPFAAFRQREVDDSASSLPIHDRIGFTSGKMLMTNRTSRTVFSVYLILLHVFLLRRAFGA